MSTQIEDVVVVNITRETARLTRASFGIPLIFGLNDKFVEDFKIYTSQADVLLDFLSTDEEAIASNAVFSQEFTPESVIIGKRGANVSQDELCSVDTVVDATDYTTTINGTAFTHNSGGGATAVTIAAGLVGQINGGSEPVTAGDNLDGTYNLVADLAGENFTLIVDVNQSFSPAVLSNNVATELAAFQQKNDDWYALILARSATEADQILDIDQASTYIETQLKLYGAAIDQATLLTSDITDIGTKLKGESLDRTFLMYSDNEEAYPEAAWFGRQLSRDPGSTTWKFKTLVGITPDTLNATELANLKAKNVNHFETVAGVSIITSEAVVSGGEFIDVIRGSDWLQTRIAEGIFAELIRTEKVPYTIQGIGVIENELRARLQEGVDNGFLTPGSVVVTTPAFDSISSANKAARLLDDVTFSAQLAGAIHKTIIEGTLTL